MHTLYAKMEYMDLLDNMRIFIRLSEKHSFSGVAKDLGLTQPTVSKAIATLETHLGVPLFLRSSRGLRLTGEGEMLLRLGSPALDQLESALAAVKDERFLLKGELKIASALGFTRLILVPLLQDFSVLHPELRLNFEVSDSYANMVEEGIDLAIRHGEQEDSALRAIAAGSWRRAVYAAPAYIARHGAPATVEELKTHKLLYYNAVRGRPSWKFNDLDGTPRTFHFQPYMQSDGADLMREATIAGLGVAFAPTWLMRGLEQGGQVVRLLEQYCTAAHPTYIVMSGMQAISAKQRAMADFLRARFADIPELNFRQA
jgi:DNA-binding transcriptional LysR family regulator